MAFDTTARSGRWTYLVQIELSTGTIYYSNAPVIVDNQPYQARLRSTPNISTQLTDILNPVQTASAINLTLANEDQALTTLIQNNTWGNRVVKLYIGEGSSLSSGYTQVFEGTVRFPNGWRWNEDTATVTVNDRRVKDSKDLPIKSSGMGSTLRYGTSEYPTMDQQFLTNPKQILIGDWNSGVGSERIRAVCVNTTTKKFKIAGHAVQSIDAVYKQNGLTAFTAVSFSSVSLTDASFILDVAYDSTKDVITVHAKGAETSNSTLIETPSAVLKYLLQTHLGVATTSINQTVFTQLETDATQSLRRYIDTVKDSSVLITEIARDVGIDFYIKEGQYQATTSTVSSVLTGLTTLRAEDIIPDSFEAIGDPDNNYFNSITIAYKFNPETGKYKEIDDDSATAIADVGATINRTFQFNWLYDDTETAARRDNLLFIFSQEPTTVLATFKHKALLHYIADRVYLNYSNDLASLNYYAGTPFQVRRIDLDPEEMQIKLRLWDISRIVSYGAWAPDTINAWSGETEENRSTYGWWTDDNGEIVTGDPNTARSLWATDTAI